MGTRPFGFEASVSFDSSGALCGRRHVAAQLAQRIGFDLPDALCRDAVLVGELVQRGLLFRHPALLQDVPAAHRPGAPWRPAGDPPSRFPTRPLPRSRPGQSPARAGKRPGCTRRPRPTRGRVEGHVASRQALLHLRDFGGGHAQVPGHGLRFLGREPGQVLLHPAQVEEQLALRLGRGDLHEAPVPQHVLMDLGRIQ